MKFADIIRTAFANFRVNKMRTMLTVAGVSIGIGAILFLVSLGFGLQRLTEQRLLNLQTLSMLTVSPGRSQLLRLDDSAIARFKELAHVEGVSGTMSIPAQIKFGSTIDSRSVLYGIDPANIEIEGLKISAGKPFSTDEPNTALITKKTLKSFEMEDEKSIIGKEVAVTAFMSSKKVEEDIVAKAVTERGRGGTESAVIVVASPSVSLRRTGTRSATPSVRQEAQRSSETQKEERTFTIVGVVDNNQLAGLFVPASVLRELGVRQYQFVKIQMDDRVNVPAAKKQVESMGFIVQTVVDTLTQVRRIFGIIQIVLGGFGVIALFVASIGMFNTLTISLLERTHDIGIMKAIGATNWDIRRMFLAEAVLMSIMGGVAGVVVGFGVGQIINVVINILAHAAGGEPAPLFRTPLLFVVAILIFSALTGFLTGFYPAQRATKLSPVEALRYE